MIQLSNDDFAKTLRLLRVLASQKGETLRDRENGRRAGLLVKKFERKKSHIKAFSSRGNKLYYRTDKNALETKEYANK